MQVGLLGCVSKFLKPYMEQFTLSGFLIYGNRGSSHPLSDADRVRRSSKSRKLLRKEWCVDASLRGYCTVKPFAVVVIPPALVTEIGPDVAPAGTVASMK